MAHSKIPSSAAIAAALLEWQCVVVADWMQSSHLSVLVYVRESH